MIISIIIPAHNEEKYLSACLASIHAHKGPEVIEVIVVDNASTDRTAAIAASFAGVRVVHEPNKGLTRARQRGLEEARGEWIAYFDADTRIPQQWFGIVKAVITADSRIVCLSGPHDFYDLELLSRLMAWFYWTILALPVYWFVGYMVVGGNFIARKSALVAMGGFDTNIVFYGEDTDIAVRLHRFGTVRFIPRLRLLTSGRRLKAEGMLKTAVKYVLNYVWEVIFHRPLTHTYKDIR